MLPCLKWQSQPWHLTPFVALAEWELTEWLECERCLEEVWLMKRSHVSTPTTCQIQAGHINLTSIEEASSKNHIMRHTVIVKHTGLDCLDPATEQKLWEWKIVVTPPAAVLKVWASFGKSS
jgi:hypothetical protein